MSLRPPGPSSAPVAGSRQITPVSHALTLAPSGRSKSKDRAATRGDASGPKVMLGNHPSHPLVWNTMADYTARRGLKSILNKFKQ